MSEITTKIPLLPGTRFKVSAKDCHGLTFEVTRVAAGTNPDNPQFDTVVDDKKGERLGHLSHCWPESALLYHAKRGELSIAK